jgi:hypothetical protein
LVHSEIKAQFVAVKNALARINPKFPLLKPVAASPCEGGGNCDKRAFTFAAIQVNLSAENESHP